MNICDCFKHEYGYAYSGRCSGTKEMDWCSCGGDETKCNFYPEKKKKASVMNTAEMWLKAQKDGKMYRSIDLAYSKKTGFVDFDDMKTPWPMGAIRTIDEIFDWDDWEEVENIMTIEEAELKYGIKIIR